MLQLAKLNCRASHECGGCAAHRFQRPSSPITMRPPGVSTGHFRDRPLRISNEAKYGYRNHTVKTRIFERQQFRLPRNEPYLCGFGLVTLLRSGNHLGVCVEPRNCMTTSSEFHCKGPVTAADV